MKYLLDTHAVLWYAEDSSLISGKARAVISDADNEKYVSIVSAWELAIKLGTKKLNPIRSLCAQSDAQGFHIA